MKKCKTCKSWNKKGQPEHDDIYARCDRIIEANLYIERDAIAYVSDCIEGPFHSFHTRGDFGCSLWEALLE